MSEVCQRTALGLDCVVDFKFFGAVVNLMYRTVLHFLRALNPFRDDFGKARFLENYVPDGLPPATAASRRLRTTPGTCTACGGCDAVCPYLSLEAYRTFEGPMAFVLSGTRAAPQFEESLEDIRLLQSDACQECRLCELSCPEGIQILALAEDAWEQQEIIDTARGHAPRALVMGQAPGKGSRGNDHGSAHR